MDYRAVDGLEKTAFRTGGLIVMTLARVAALGSAMVALSLPLAAGAQNLIVNGGFELPVQVSGGFTDYAVGSSGIPGWSIVGVPGTFVTVVDQDFAGNPGYSFPAQGGRQWLDLAGFTDNAPNGVQQSIVTAIGETYELTFYVGNISGGFFGVQTQVNAEFSSGGTNFSCLNVTQTTTMTWLSCSQQFVATEGLTTFTLRNADPTSDFSSAIDNVSFALVTGAAVPEPAAWAMLICGFGLIGGALRRHGSSRQPLEA